jgi:hypothetical protein
MQAVCHLLLKPVSVLIAAASVFLVAGCGNIPLEETPPESFDLSGHWVLADGQSALMNSRNSAGMNSGFMAQDFPLLTAREMHIEQDARSMGIEYRRGSYRDVTWGERRRGVWEVRSGWHEGALYIYSEAADISAAEIWRLSEDGERLDISISVRGARDREFQRVFQRASGI